MNIYHHTQVCPNCHTVYQGNHVCPTFSHYWNQLPTVQMGCICPPGANKDCEAPTCPRKKAPGTP